MVQDHVVSKEGATYLRSSDPGISKVGGVHTTMEVLGRDPSGGLDVSLETHFSQMTLSGQRTTSHPLIQPISPPNRTPRLAAHAEPSPYVSSLQSSPQVHPVSLSPPPCSTPHHTSRFASSETPSPPIIDSYSTADPAVHLRATGKHSRNQQPPLDQRRMSEPIIYGSAASGHLSNTTDPSAVRYQESQRQISYVSSPFSPAQPSPPPLSSNTPPAESWKQDNRLSSHRYDVVEPEEPFSLPLPTFSGEGFSSVGMPGAIFGSPREDYSPPPSDTETSTSSNTPTTNQLANTTVESSSPSNAKQYSFASLPRDSIKKRPRRRYDEIERLYRCSWKDCTKAYGTLNHLNAHVTMQKHGPKRGPNEFKGFRKQWRKAKKEEAEHRTPDAMHHASYPFSRSSQHHSSRHSMSGAEHQAQDMRPLLDYSHRSQRPTQSSLPVEDLHDTHHRSYQYAPSVSSPFQQSETPYSHSRTHSVNTSDLPANRLPPGSTLLTPLPGYGSTGTPDSTRIVHGLYRSDSRSRSSPERHSDRE